MNITSSEGVLPVDGDDPSPTIGDVVLRCAAGTETFTPLGSPETVEQSDQWEIIYVDEGSGHVMCRRWNWRNGHITRTTGETQALVMNIGGLGEQSEQLATQFRDRVAELLSTYCDAHTATALIP
jgi:DNA/RNA-binding domain of Phe-tRNA-synthetase-like protein